jgi:hypothetical protein
MAAAICFVAAGSLCLLATSSEAAKRSSASAKHKSVTKQRSGSPTAKQKPDVPTDRTPTNKDVCLAVAQALYGRAASLSKRTKLIIPREFRSVTANLDESCGEEDFEKARISIDWMNTCLANYTTDYSLGFCTRNKTYFCGINPWSEACLQRR